MSDYYRRVSRAWIALEPTIRKVVKGEIMNIDLKSMIFSLTINPEISVSRRSIVRKINEYLELYPELVEFNEETLEMRRIQK